MSRISINPQSPIADDIKLAAEAAGLHIGHPDDPKPSLPLSVIEAGEPLEYLLLASYCGNDNPACTEQRPCADCLAMCNIFDGQGNFLRELGDARTANETGKWSPHLDYAGEPMRPGEFRDSPEACCVDESRGVDGTCRNCGDMA